MMTLNRLRKVHLFTAGILSLIMAGFQLLLIKSRMVPATVSPFILLFAVLFLSVTFFNGATTTLMRAAKGEGSSAPVEIDGSKYLRWMGIQAGVVVLAVLVGAAGYKITGLVLIIGVMMLRTYMRSRPSAQAAGETSKSTSSERISDPRRARWGAFRIVGSMVLTIMSTVIAGYLYSTGKPIEQVIPALAGIVGGWWLLYWQTGVVAREFGIPREPGG